MAGSRVERDRQRELARDVEALDQPDDPRPGSCVCITTVVKTYPTVAGVYYAVQIAEVSGEETEGTAATFTPVGSIFYAAHIGTTAPPKGKNVVVDPVDDGRWAFVY